MRKNLVGKIGSIDQDNLIAKLTPTAETFGIKLKKLDSECTVRRGTLLAADEEGKYSIYGGKGAVPSAILAEDVEVGTGEDAVGVAYRSGNFNPDAIITADDYTLTVSDIDTLRKYDIIFTQML